MIRKLCALVLILTALIIPVASAYLGTISAFYATVETKYNLMDSNNAEVYNINGYLYVLGTSATSTDSRRWKSSDDGGLTWSTASDALQVDETTGHSDFTGYLADSVYDNVTGYIYVVFLRNSASQSPRDLTVNRYIAFEGSMLLVGTHTLLDSNSTYGYLTGGGGVSITVLDGKPVIALSANQRDFRNFSPPSGLDEGISVFFASSSTPTDISSYAVYWVWANQTGYANELFDLDVQAVNSTSVCVVYTSLQTSADINGWFFNNATGAEPIYTPISSGSVERLIDANNQVLSLYSVTSEHNKYRRSYAGTLAVLYGETTTYDLIFDLWNVSSRSVTNTTILYNSANSTFKPYSPSIVWHNDGFFIGYTHYNGTNFWHNFYIRERDYTGVWSADQFQFVAQYSTSNYAYIFLTKNIFNNRLHGLITDNLNPVNTESYFYLDAYGDSAPVVDTPGYWETFSVPFSLIFGLTGLGMVFGGGIWSIHNIRQRELKQIINGVIIFLVGVAIVIGWFFG